MPTPETCELSPDIKKRVNGHQLRFISQEEFAETSSEEVQDIMSRMPGWMISRGSGILFLVMGLIICGSYFIHYPDVIVTRVNILSSNPPVKIIAATSGKIQQLFIQNNATVKKEDPVCLLENPADYHDITRMKSWLKKLDTTRDLHNVLSTFRFDEYLQLGELQGAYTDLYQAVNQYNFFSRRHFVSRKLLQLQSQVGYQAQLTQALHEKDLLLKEQLMIERKKFLSDSSLVADKVIAPLEFENSRKELLTRQMNADATKTSILQNKLQQTEYMKTITDLQQQKLQQENDLQQNIRENVKRLAGLLDVWEQKYLVKSPVDGKAVFFKFWKENQYVNAGESLLTIVPPIQHFIARSMLPVDGAGKVRTGQKVLIRLSSFPFQEFGMIRGSVSAVSSVAMDSVYSLDIELTNGLITTSNKSIPPQPQLTGTAEVLTNDKSILERLFESMVY